MSAAVVCANRRARAGQRQRRFKAAAAAGQSNDPNWAQKSCSARKVLPAAMPTRVIGFYAKGCIAGAEACRSMARPGR